MITPSNEFWKIFKETPGALSCAESLAIMNIAAEAPTGRDWYSYIELGTHKGKSAMSAIMSLKNGKFALVDPIFSDKKLASSVIFMVFDFGENVGVGASERTSIEELNYTNPLKYSYVFVDSGSHGDGLPMQEAKLLEDRMVQGGIIAWHDYKNQFVEVEQAYNYLLSTGKYEEIIINWQEIFDYVKEHNLEEGNNSWHLYPELPHPPNFVGALKRK